MAKTKNGVNAETETVSEILAVTQENANVENVSETLTDEQILDDVTNQWFDAKDVLNAIESEMLKKRERKNDAHAKQMLIVNDLYKKMLNAEKIIDAKKMQKDLDEKLVNAKQTLADVLGITDEKISELLADDADVKKTLENLKWSFDFVFGKRPLIAKENQTGKSLVNGNAKNGDGSKFNLSAAIKDLLNAGKNDNDVFDELSQNPNISYEPKILRKRITDIRWNWEVANGLRKAK
jgi:hypothetical protein